MAMRVPLADVASAPIDMRQEMASPVSHWTCQSPWLERVRVLPDWDPVSAPTIVSRGAASLTGTMPNMKVATMADRAMSGLNRVSLPALREGVPGDSC